MSARTLIHSSHNRQQSDRCPLSVHSWTTGPPALRVVAHLRQKGSDPTVSAKEPKSSRTGTLHYAIAIYPYIVGREDEFDAAV